MNSEIESNLTHLQLLGALKFFNEDNKIYLKIHTSEENSSVLNLKELNHFSSDGEYLYIFASNKREALDTIFNSFDKNKLISHSLDIAN